MTAAAYDATKTDLTVAFLTFRRSEHIHSVAPLIRRVPRAPWRLHGFRGLTNVRTHRDAVEFALARYPARPTAVVRADRIAIVRRTPADRPTRTRRAIFIYAIVLKTTATHRSGPCGARARCARTPPCSRVPARARHSENFTRVAFRRIRAGLTSGDFAIISRGARRHAGPLAPRETPKRSGNRERSGTYRRGKGEIERAAFVRRVGEQR